jgi:SAM-dependent MidA family methyltransferase
MKLCEVIKQRIATDGPISFRDFMEAALYYPGLGYYTAARDQIGKNGDFYTSSNLGPVFGSMIGKQVEEMWRLTGETSFTIVEYGAGTGALCHDILDYLKRNPKFYDQLHYAIIEKSPSMREREKTHLVDKVSWYDAIEDLGEITGCILSNELFDNFAVHRVVMDDELMEIFVDEQDGFAELLRPCGRELKDYLVELNISLPKGFQTEINLQAIHWLQEVSKFLIKGYILTIDYGYSAEELYCSRRSNGTLLCYHRHGINDNFYQDIGEQDITAHINFSALRHWGQQYGLGYCGMTSQAHFLLALGFKDYLRENAQDGGNIVQLAMEEVRMTRTLLVDMGSKFKVLIQQKGMSGLALSGLQFS